MLAGNHRGQAHADHVFRSERLGGNHGGQGGIDAAGETEQGFLEAGLLRVVTDAKHEGVVDVGELGLFVGRVPVGRNLRLSRCRGAARRDGSPDLDHFQLFAESREAAENPARGVAGDTPALENKFVVAADGVAINGGTTAGLGGIRHQGPPQRVLGHVPRTGGKIKQQIDLLVVQPFDRVHVVQSPRRDERMDPDVLTDSESDLGARELHDDRLARGLEITVLIKDVVGRQQALAGGGKDFTLEAKGGGIVGGATLPREVGLGVADDGGHPANLGRDGLRGLLDVGDKAFFKEQITRRVAADRQFRVEHEFGALGHQGVVGVEDAPAVAGKVADDGVYLGQADAHNVAANLRAKRWTATPSRKRTQSAWRFPLEGSRPCEPVRASCSD